LYRQNQNQSTKARIHLIKKPTKKIYFRVIHPIDRPTHIMPEEPEKLEKPKRKKLRRLAKIESESETSEFDFELFEEEEKAESN